MKTILIASICDLTCISLMAVCYIKSQSLFPEPICLTTAQKESENVFHSYIVLSQ